MAIYLVKLDFQDGNGFIDITDLVLQNSFQIKRTLNNNYKPTTDTLDFTNDIN